MFDFAKLILSDSLSGFLKGHSCATAFRKMTEERRSKRVPPQKILKFQSPKNAIFSVLGTKFENKRACFSFKKM